MSMRMKFYAILAMIASLLLFLAFCTNPSSAAEPGQYVIAAGKSGGGYDKRSKQIAERLNQRQMPTTVVNMNGSDEISLAICGGKAQIGIMQIDAMYARTLEGCRMKPVAVYGEEVAVMLVPPKSSIDELSDLNEQSAVMVDTIGSGSDLFWHTIVKIEQGDDGSKDSWAKARVVNDPLELAMPNATMGDVQAVILVRKSDSPDISNLLGLGWSLAELWDKDINDLTFGGASLYEGGKVDILVQGKKLRNYGYLVRSFIAVSDDVANGDRAKFAAIVGSAQ